MGTSLGLRRSLMQTPEKSKRGKKRSVKSKGFYDNYDKIDWRKNDSRNSKETQPNN